jgi:hypothetical protein
MKKNVCPKSMFRTGVVKEVSGWAIRVIRENYKGHEHTWWDMDDWLVLPVSYYSIVG